MNVLLWILGLGAAAAIVVAISVRWRRAADVRVVTCPETGEKQAVKVDAGRALTHGMSKDAIELTSCSRWPERHDCDQPCRQQIASAPDGCFARSKLDAFYANANCSLCGNAFGDAVDWTVHEPGLLDADGQVSVWRQYPAESLDEVLADRQPVCWDCVQIQRLAEEHPERITVRPHKKSAQN